ncbi:MAG: DUF1549 domain-containing protein [Myxococcota bacterium]
MARNRLLLLFAAAIGAGYAVWPAHAPGYAKPARLSPEERAIAEAFDAAAGISADPAVDELLVFRRASLSLLGLVPSLEATRSLMTDRRVDRLERRFEAMLSDPRFSRRFGERIAQAVAGVDGHQPFLYRGDRLAAYVAAALDRRAGYAEIVQDLVGGQGLWTSAPASNFITAGLADGNPRRDVLTTRLARGFLGQRMDCAACHDHPFTDLRHEDFAHLAAFFRDTEVNLAGVVDHPHTSTITPRVPFGEAWLPKEGPLRERLARWLIHPENQRLRLAIANRATELVFGRAWIDPVDDLPDEGEALLPLTILADDLAQHHDDLFRLVRILLATHLFRAPSKLTKGNEVLGGSFPITRLEPEVLARSLVQMSEVRDIEGKGPALMQAVRWAKERGFVEASSDPSSRGGNARSTTLPEMLLLLNGELTQDAARAGPLSSAGRIAGLSDAAAVEAMFLTVLVRRPEPEEARAFALELAETTGKAREAAIEDAMTALIASPEVLWNH